VGFDAGAAGLACCNSVIAGAFSAGGSECFYAAQAGSIRCSASDWPSGPCPTSLSVDGGSQHPLGCCVTLHTDPYNGADITGLSAQCYYGPGAADAWAASCPTYNYDAGVAQSWSTTLF
jgi:hypothetical protein